MLLFHSLYLFVSILFLSLRRVDAAFCESGLEADQCPSIMKCLEPLVKINMYSCARSLIFATPSKCPTGLECWTGRCITDERNKALECPTIITCPPTNTKCPDNSCVDNPSDCSKYYDCPSFNPIRCPNGDCRKTLDDCPTVVTCDTKFPMECNDGSCHATAESCKKVSEQTKCEDPFTRCPDGTCTKSKFLCATPSTCPIGYMKCWDGNCSPIGNCTKPIKSLSNTCGDENKILCAFDFSCATRLENCPTGIICPVDKPVKCWDNSCRDSIQNCPAYQGCPSGLKTCADGSCGVGSCGTHISCSTDAPYRCFDNTCRQNPKDCPAQPSCSSETPILCWDGRCLAERGECLAPSLCENNNYPIKCPNGLCVASFASCKQTPDCPSEFIKCKDGTCRQKSAYCPEEKCPVNLPNKCTNGLCVSDKKFCELDNGCPFNMPIRCKDGSCIPEGELCPDNIRCNPGTHLCPDGSCLPLKTACPSETGCPIDTPIKCADGTCINPKKAKCNIPICPPNTPVRCFDGTCVETTDFCPTEKKVAPSGLVLCADGREANSYDECKIIFACEEDQVRCGDGSCREHEDYCPMANTCPEGQIRCDGGSCSDSLENCPEPNGCPRKAPRKCANSGFCVKDDADCEDKEGKLAKANGCPADLSYKCENTQKCAIDKNGCYLDNGCPAGFSMCDNGACVSEVTACVEENKKSTECSDDLPFDCPPDSVAICAKSINECYNSRNCPFGKPLRCLNGECKRFPFKEYSNDEDGCELAISCPNYRPVLCADGSCVEKEKFCTSFISCPSETPDLCFDKTCAEKNACEASGHQKCPSKNPVQCPNSNCVSSIYDCRELTCPLWMPYLCVIGSCTTKPRDCFKLNFDPIEFEYKEGSLCREDETMCYDGTCRRRPKDCPIFPGCSSTALPFKCLDGSCALSKEQCEHENEPGNFTCPEGTEICEDGMCRANCSFVEYYGCPHELPLLCPNGRCVLLSQECVGESSCDSTEKPFRCIDGSCAATMDGCKNAFREFGDTNVTISIFPQTEVSADLMIGSDNLLIGSITVPSETITVKSDNSSNKVGAETKIYIRSVPRSALVDTYSTYDRTREDDLKAVYPFSDPSLNYTLSYQYSVLSTAFEFKLAEPNRTEISGKIIMTLLYDFPYKHTLLQKSKESIYEAAEESNKKERKNSRYTAMPLNYLRDVCLAKLEEKTREWKCMYRTSDIQDLNNLQLKGDIIEEGTYAVILYLKMNTTPLFISDNWFINHLKELTFILIGILVLIGIAAYIFIRIYRYRVKYKGTKETYEGFEVELSELQGKSVTGRQGQTLGDVKEGIIYTDNIAFQAQPSEARKHNLQLEKLFDGFSKKLKVLEKNNAILKNQYDATKEEYDRMKKYKAEIEEAKAAGPGVKVNIEHGTKELDPIGDSNEGLGEAINEA